MMTSWSVEGEDMCSQWRRREAQSAIVDVLAGARYGGIAFPHPFDDSIWYFSGLVVRGECVVLLCPQRWAGIKRP